ncbi:hypothetical protein PybrP1_000042 [[Pythium] brassicae (nom. inval.)]|nr:hypothetical protein PybrP1_000042 [[Pythium] brassicae (nom. inval.)]
MSEAHQTPPHSPSSSASSSPAASPSAIGTITKDANGKPKKCRFNDCDNHAVDGTSKCAFHKNRRQCCVESCTNQVYARKLCVRHGGKKQCQADNCDAHARGGGFCLQHGGFVVKRFCIVEGCSKQAHARQKCVRHGGGRRCKVDGCMQHARAGGLCNRHSHGHECRVDGCTKTAQHSGSICFRHAMEMRAHGEAISVPTTMPKFSLRTPLGGNGFPTPRTHDFSLLMGLPSPQIDTSQLPSVLAMSNAGGANGSQRPLYEPPTPLTASLFGLSGPPSITRGSRGSYLSLGMFPTSEKTPHSHGGEEDIDTFINSYSKFMAPEAASPITYHHHANQYAMPPLLDNIGLNVFENNAHHVHHAAQQQQHAAAMNGRQPPPPPSSQQQHLQRAKMDFMASSHNQSNGGGGGHFEPPYHHQSAASSGPSDSGSHDYTAQFFAADSNANKSDLKGGRALKPAKAPVPKVAGVTAA